MSSRRAELAALFPPGERTIVNILCRQAERHGDRIVLRFGETAISFRDLRNLAARFAGALKDAGVRSGDRVALMCGNRLEFVEAFVGCAWLGAIVVPINVASRGAQLAHVIRDSAPKLLLTEPANLSVFADLPVDALPMDLIWSFDPPPLDKVKNAACRLAPPRDVVAAPASARPGDIAAILYTSGTTGPSKGVCLPNAQYFWWGANGVNSQGLVPEDILYTCLPLFHINAQHTFMESLLLGCELTIEARFSASGFWPAVRQTKATVVYLIGAIVPILLGQEPRADDCDHALRLAMCPGISPADFVAFPKRFNVRLMNAYGSTETNQIMGHADRPQRPGSLGFCDENYEARVVDAEDAEVPDGTPGELVLRGREPFSLAAGYLNLPGKTVEAWRNLWFHTGDRVRRDPDGQFLFIDRVKDSIRRRGENISSYEVEDVLRSHPAIAAATVYAVPSALGEDEVMAALVLAEDAEVEFLDIVKYCEQHLAYFCVPRYLRVVEDLPVTETGKVKKFVLRDEGVTDETFDLEETGYKLKR
ncbi:hypothetical protein CCR94_01480 [Rhodoblastus sphagnicola]|uniref:ATP-dependent acyl-CoA ligase n=1 Tax=Rhodoblastus sphagnicola TaxID=333368 RepID=A0A2S6NG57_9HYPH|nr:AMP-binding protein [Rhodoblastus sphagnicola]MBB4199485.1 crotonobetaine/carnitine-CoA ligase [Rhodoblastus sphagnicola]PPQ33549.1 hypothetical protein CCR94_01480 [Rhodoblastus sphagnicola]